MATHSSGLMPLKPSLPVSFLTISCTAGIRLEPPTIRTLEMSLPDRPASLMACDTGPAGGLHQVGGQLVELGPGQGQIQVLGAGGVGGDIGQVDVGGGDAGQLDLGLLSGLLQALHGNLVAGQVDAGRPS